MSRNIVIFADGTGQRGGLQFDERRSNIYKLYRATRAGPDSEVDPSKQCAFYDPGLGTLPGGVDSPAAAARSLYNLASQATGLGITHNITACYAFSVRLWRPGDRIFLFGFSRGAYTVRCLAGVLRLCGIPTTMPDGSPLRRDDATSKHIARRAVHGVYTFTNSRPRDGCTARQSELLQMRESLAARFRTRYQSDVCGEGNSTPHFIGVFDTVASLANPSAVLGLIALGAFLIGVAAIFPLLLWGHYLRGLIFLLSGGASAALVTNISWRIKFAAGVPGFPWWKRLHFASFRMQMYDTDLDQRVGFGRHALSIDERRGSFQRVPWGNSGAAPAGRPDWFEQMWFAGNHSDVGGSYVENESRLSDISLHWMLNAATQSGLLYDGTVLDPSPDHAGMQHDETRTFVFRHASKVDRTIPSDAPLHPTVLKRFKEPCVQQYDTDRPYRPEPLRHHQDCREFY